MSYAAVTPSRKSPSRNSNLNSVKQQFREIEWDVAFSWQLWDICGCLRVFVAVTGSMFYTALRVGVTKALANVRIFVDGFRL